jgi:hypothetical protein
MKGREVAIIPQQNSFFPQFRRKNLFFPQFTDIAYGDSDLIKQFKEREAVFLNLILQFV